VINLVINGETHRTLEETTLEQLLAGLRVDPATVVVEHNGSLVARTDADRVVLRPEDRLEIVRFVAGG